VNPKKRES
jgi:hypothetical protein